MSSLRGLPAAFNYPEDFPPLSHNNPNISQDFHSSVPGYPFAALNKSSHFPLRILHWNCRVPCHPSQTFSIWLTSTISFACRNLYYLPYPDSIYQAFTPSDKT